MLERSWGPGIGGAGDGNASPGAFGAAASCPCTFLPCRADPKHINTLPQRAERMWLAGEERLEKFLPWG